MTKEQFLEGWRIIISSYSYMREDPETAKLLYRNFFKGLNGEQFKLACENACRDYRDIPPTTGQLLYEYDLLIPRFQKQEEQKKGVPMPEDCKEVIDKLKEKMKKRLDK